MSERTPHEADVPEFAFRINPPAIKRSIILPDEYRYDLPLYPAYENLLYIGKLTREWWSTPSQYHPYFELCYVAEGTGWFMFEGMFQRVAKGDVFLTKLGQVHHGGGHGGAPYLLYYFGFRLDRLRSLELHFFNLEQHTLARDGDGQIQALCDRIMEEITGCQTCSVQMSQAVFLELLVHVLRLYDHEPGGTSSERPGLSTDMKQVLTVLHTDFSYIAKIDELARRVNLSRSHLDREFKKHMSVSLGEYVRALSLERAKYFLRETADPISDISDRLHFETLQGFSMFFKRHAGMSPKEYRDLIRDAESESAPPPR